MAFRNCFSTPNKDSNSSDYISRKKSKTIYKNAIDLANNNGVYHKKSVLGQNKGTYIGNINISRDGNKCLVSTKDYATLQSVTNGKHLVNPDAAEIYLQKKQLWNGLMYNMDLSSNNTIISYPDGTVNTFTYPPTINANNTYPNLIPPSDQGLIVDPSYNLFYPDGVLTESRDNCYVNDETAYQKRITLIQTQEKKYVDYVNNYGGYIGGYQYPQRFNFDINCNKNKNKNKVVIKNILLTANNNINYVINIQQVYAAWKSNPNAPEFTDHMSEVYYGPIENWNTSLVTNMSKLFQNDNTFNSDISKWNVSNVTNMEYMFAGASVFDQPINNWNVSKVTNMNGMFNNAKVFNKPLNNWNVSNVTNIYNMFANAHAFNQDISGWNVSNVTNINNMFNSAYAFNQPLNNWNVSKVTNMDGMFNSAYAFNNPLNNWNVSNVTNMQYMFFNTKTFNQNIEGWNVSKVTNMQYMFSGAISFNQPLNNWNVDERHTNVDNMFSGAIAFNQPLNNWYSNTWGQFGANSF